MLHLNPRKRRAMYFNVMFILRRVVMAFIIVIVAEQSYLQIQLLIVKTSLVLYYTGDVWPFERRINNKMELANELCILLNTYFMIVYSDFVSSAEARYQMGWYNLAIMIAQVLVSGGLVVINQGQAVFRAIKLQWLKRVTAKKAKKMAKDVVQQRFKAALVGQSVL